MIETNICPLVRLCWYAHGDRNKVFRGFDNFNDENLRSIPRLVSYSSQVKDDRSASNASRLKIVQLEYRFSICLKFLKCSNSLQQINGYWILVNLHPLKRSHRCMTPAAHQGKASAHALAPPSLSRALCSTIGSVGSSVSSTSMGRAMGLGAPVAKFSGAPVVVTTNTSASGACLMGCLMGGLTGWETERTQINMMRWNLVRVVSYKNIEGMLDLATPSRKGKKKPQPLPNTSINNHVINFKNNITTSFDEQLLSHRR